MSAKVIPFQSSVERIWRGRKLKKEQSKLGKAIRIMRGWITK